MHVNQHKWLRDVKRQYPAHFEDAFVLEIGSRNWSGEALSPRRYFRDGAYLGVDRMPGSGVDLSPEASHRLLQDNAFDTLVALSVYEHEPRWRHVFTRNGDFLRPGGLAIVSFGAEGNQHHDPEPWSPVPHDDFLILARANGFSVLDSFFEEDRYGKECAGCYNVLLRKSMETP